MDAEVPYKFNIVNCEKINSQFNFGKLIVSNWNKEVRIEVRTRFRDWSSSFFVLETLR